jgi:hypothetical protein
VIPKAEYALASLVIWPVRLGLKGLGLSIARRAAERHKGAIRTFNADPGLAVEIELPGPIVSEVREAPAERVERSGPVG